MVTVLLYTYFLTSRVHLDVRFSLLMHVAIQSFSCNSNFQVAFFGDLSPHQSVAAQANSFKLGEVVEYYSASQGSWIPAKVGASWQSPKFGTA